MNAADEQLRPRERLGHRVSLEGRRRRPAGEATVPFPFSIRHSRPKAASPEVTPLFFSLPSAKSRRTGSGLTRYHRRRPWGPSLPAQFSASVDPTHGTNLDGAQALLHHAVPS